MTAFDTIKDCLRCGKTFPNCKAWSAHITACYCKKPRPDEKPVVSTLTSAAASSEEDVKDDCSVSSSTTSAYYEQGSPKPTSEVDDLMGSLPGWCSKGKRGSCGLTLSLALSSSSASSASVSAIDDRENKESPQLDMFPIKKQKLRGFSPEPDLGLFKFKDLSSLEPEGQDKKKKEVVAERGDSSLSCKDNGVLGQPGKYECKECGQEFSDFRGLGGHVSSHNRKRRMQDGGFAAADEEDGFQFQFRTKPKNHKGGGGVHQCDQCDKSFPTGQALGGHKRVHWTGFAIKKFDLNQLPPEARFLT